ncbi:MAG: CHAT domain-containing tetratricopeptide repeat protein [Planctomycetota bacterium]|nr:CHAT domain-containing tetratricopeptide repeat protein [Planctomycetota bacterium]
MCTRGARWIGIVAILLVGPALTAANDDIDGAERARIAHGAGDEAALDRVANSKHGDVWRVVERLAAQGHAEIGKALAERTKDAKLVDYAAWRAVNPLSNDVLLALDRVTAHRRARQGDAARKALAAIDGELEGVVAVTRDMHRLYLSKQPDEALEAGRAAAERAQRIGWRIGERMARAGCVNLAWTLKRYDDVTVHGALLLENLGTGGARMSRYRVHIRVSQAHRRAGRAPEAIEHAVAALELAPTKPERAKSLRYVTTLDAANPDAHLTHRRLLELRALEVEAGNGAYVAGADVRLAVTEATLGLWSSAVDRIESALAYFEAGGEDWARRGAYLNAARLALEMFDPRGALRHVRAARAIATKRVLDEAPLDLLEAAAYAQMDDHEGAIAAYERLVSKDRPAPRTTHALALLHLGSLYPGVGRVDDAVRVLDKAGPLVDRLGAPNLRAQLHASRSQLELARGDVDAAVEAGDEARKIADRYLLTNLAVLIEGQLAEGFFRANRFDLATRHARDGLELALRQSAALPVRLGAQYRAQMPQLLRLSIEAPLRADDATTAFEHAERIGAVALRNALGGPRAALDMLDADLVETEHALQKAEAVAVAGYRTAIAKRDAEAVDRASASLEDVRARLDRHRDRMHLKHAAAAQLIEPRIDTLDVVQHRLADAQALVRFAVGVTQVHAIVITRKAVRVVAMGTPASWRTLLDTLVLEDPSAPWEAPWKRLRERVVTTLALPKSIRDVVVIPTGQLDRLPFQALWPERRVTLLPSATVGRLLTERGRDAPGGILAVGDPAGGRPLPAAEREAAQIGDVTLVGKAATESAARSAIGKREHWAAIHFACHAAIDPENPTRSALELAASKGADGFLTVGEILRMRVSTDLVVLAACSSAGGTAFEQEGRVGLVHAFFVAGAKRVLASLWDVDDRATEVFMRGFYEALAKTDPATALRLTQAAMQKHPAFSHPAHWAGWQLWGP